MHIGFFLIAVDMFCMNIPQVYSFSRKLLFNIIPPVIKKNNQLNIFYVFFFLTLWGFCICCHTFSSQNHRLSFSDVQTETQQKSVISPGFHRPQITRQNSNPGLSLPKGHALFKQMAKVKAEELGTHRGLSFPKGSFSPCPTRQENPSGPGCRSCGFSGVF